MFPPPQPRELLLTDDEFGHLFGEPSQRGQRREMGVFAVQFWNVLLPGRTSWSIDRRLAVLWVIAGTMVPALIVAWMLVGVGSLTSVALRALRPGVFWALVAAAVIWFLARVVTVLWYGWSSRDRRIGAATVSALLFLGVFASPTSFALSYLHQISSKYGNLVEGNTDVPLFVPETIPERPVEPPVTPETTTTVPQVPETTTTTTEPEIPLPELHTTLLLGGDGASGRWLNRTDSMMLVSVNAATGESVIISVPRNMTKMRFPKDSPLHRLYPQGFDDLANAIFTRVESDPALVAAYSADPARPDRPERAAARAIAESIGYTFGIQVDDYLFVNLLGFINVIDTLGGVTIDVPKTTRLPPNVADPTRVVPAQIPPGPTHMDGAVAMAYARTRYQDSDIERTERQRQIMAGIIQQNTPIEILGKLPQVLDDLDGTVITSISADQVERFGRLLPNLIVVESTHLARPIINTGNPDFDKAKQHVADTLKLIQPNQNNSETSSP